MALDPKKTRWFPVLALVACGAATTTVGCSSAPEESVTTDDGSTSSNSDITSISETAVKRQSIGNCWLYATTSWLEALDKAATNAEINTSESWLTYWHWYEQLANGTVYSGEIQTGGSYGTAANLINRYGVVLEKDFIAIEAEAEMSNRQSTALEAVNTSLKSGALKAAVAKHDRKAIRAALDAAWKLDAATIARIDAVFGPGVDKTLDRAYVQRAPGNGVIRAKDFPVRLKDPVSGTFVTATLADATGTGSSWGQRSGKLAFNTVSYPYDAKGRREVWKRVQRALHDQTPVLMSWTVDFNALTEDAHFSLDQLNRLGPGRHGGHMTLAHDYQATVPGVGLLKAGEPATPAQMQAALSDDTKIEFLRVKNSWGGIRPDRWQNAAIPGYHDLEMAYLNGPIKDCPGEDAPSDPSECVGTTVPLGDFVLPAGY
ncbi:MAG: hypothetical protein JWP97_2962 [Labilithrix sp.]|nr:hypothetical protein [Labilithrix sp.]